mgnify:CR=1 FL=1
MGLAFRTQIYGSIALMTVGVLALTIGADVAPDPALATGLSIGGGIAVTVAGVWGFRASEKQNEYDERYLEIGLRGAAVALWVFFWGAMVLSSLDRGGGVATPALDPLTWLMLVPFVVFFGTVSYYDRVM